jgi:hypothetical protein
MLNLFKVTPYLDTSLESQTGLPTKVEYFLVAKFRAMITWQNSLLAMGYIGFPVGNVQLVKVYVGLALAGSVV